MCGKTPLATKGKIRNAWSDTPNLPADANTA